MAGGWYLDQDGMLAIPSTPGLGIRFDLEGLAKYTRATLPQIIASLRRQCVTILQEQGSTLLNVMLTKAANK